MAKNDLLKEAIADAKTVRNTALANAKAALEEAFTPKLKSMLSAKLTEELEEEINEDPKGFYEDENMEEDMYEADEAGENPEANEEVMDEEISLEEILAELELEEGGASVPEEDKVSENGKEDEDLDEEIDLTEILNEMEMDEDIDLNELLAELSEDDDEGKDPQNEVVATGLAITGALALGMLGAGILGGSAEQQIADAAKNAYKEATGKNLPDASVEKLKGGGTLPGMSPEQLKKVHSAIEDTIESLPWYKKLFKAKKFDTGQFAQKSDAGNQAGMMKEEPSDEETNEIRAELNEAYKVIKYQKGKLNEVNVLNSKLLYVNKLFKAYNLTENQKIKVVDSLDQADNTKEAKIIYNTLNETFSSVRTQLKESIKPKSFASKATGLIKENRTRKAQPVNETVARFKKLANIN